MKLRWRDLVAMKPPAMSWADTMRLVAPAVVGLAVCAWLGQFASGMLVALGSYVVLFGAGQPGRRRFRVYLIVAALMLAAVTLGVLAASSFPLTMALYLGTAVVAVVLNAAFPLGPPGPYIFALLAGGGTTVGQSGTPLRTVLLYFGTGIVLAIGFGMADMLYDRFGAERRAIAAAKAAVDDLTRAAGPLAPEAEDGERLAAAAKAVHHAWSIYLAGAGRSANADRLHALRQASDAYRALAVGLLERRLHPGDTVEAQGFALLDSADPRDAAVGEPSLSFRLGAELTWPSLTLITLLRVSLGLLLAGVVTHLGRDQHPFWATLVVVLVLSYPGALEGLTLRAGQRVLGTSVGIIAFAAMFAVGVPEAAYVALLCILIVGVARVTARNYLYGSVIITIFALYLTVPMSSNQSAGSIALNRWVDTLIAALIAVALIWLVGPGLVSALAEAGARRLGAATLAVLDGILARRSFTDPEFVEDRRRLQYRLLHVGEASSLALPHASGAAPLRLERACARLGFRVLSGSWTRLGEAEREQLAAERPFLSRLASAPLGDSAAIERGIQRMAALNSTAERTEQRETTRRGSVSAAGRARD